jgi:hypothetical protein
MRKSQFVTFLLAGAVATLTGCATLPSPQVMADETVAFQLPKLPDPGKAIIYIVRPSSLGALVRFNVFADDKQAQSEMGYTRAHQYIYFQVKPGEHTIYSKAENWADAKVSAKAGDIIYIQQEPDMGIIMARNDIYQPDDVEGKYCVKTLTLGTIKRTEK